MPVNRESQGATDVVDEARGLFALALLSLIAGAASGLLGAAFRLALEQADRFRGVLIAWTHGQSIAGFSSIVGISAAATAVAAWLVHHFLREAIGSGIPHVEAVLKGERRAVCSRRCSCSEHRSA